MTHLTNELISAPLAHRAIPSVGLGFWKIPKESTSQMAIDAVAAGYRHLDCASDYGNEPQVGEGIERVLKDRLCDREDLWITSKLWNTYHRGSHVRSPWRMFLSSIVIQRVGFSILNRSLRR